jgi:calcineurin-like phosphoesterase family protein
MGAGCGQPHLIPMTIFFISDTHFGHENILTFTGQDGQRIRRFEFVEEMDEHMVECWNRVVRPIDHVYHLGDVTMIRGTATKCLMMASPLQYVRRLNGHKRLILGNHDHCPMTAYRTVGFEKIYGVKLVDRFLCSHVPVHEGSIGKARANIHGHIHEKPSPPGPYYNVSVEARAYTPVSLEEIQGFFR